jgi:hypothetical protein
MFNIGQAQINPKSCSPAGNLMKSEPEMPRIPIFSSPMASGYQALGYIKQDMSICGFHHVSIMFHLQEKIKTCLNAIGPIGP